MLKRTNDTTHLPEVVDFSTYPYDEIVPSSAPHHFRFKAPLLGEGKIGVFSAKSDIHYFYLKCQPTEAFRLRSSLHEDTYIYFNYVLQSAGDVKSMTVDEGDYALLGDNLLIIDNTNAAERAVILPAAHPFELVQLTMSGVRFNDYLDRLLKGYTAEARQRCLDSCFTSDNHGMVIPFDVHQRRCLMDLINCPFDDAMRKDFVELKIRELLVYHFHRVINGDIEIKDTHTRVPVKHRQVISDIKAYLDSQLSELNLKEVAEKFRVTTSFINKNFKRVFGISVARYHRKQRLNQAYQELTDPNNSLSVKEIAFHSGFNSVQAFSRCFFNEYHIRPSDIKYNY